MIALSAMLSGFVIPNASATDIGALIEFCSDCHGQDGISTESDVPIIGGFSEQYLLDSMIAYIDKDRPCPETEYREGDNKGSKTDMCKIAEELSEENIEEIAEFYASKEFVPAKQTFDPGKAASAAKIHEANCEKCHEDGGSSPDGDSGILAGQWTPYLKSALKAFTSGDREMPERMQPKMEKLSDTDIEALLHYYGSLQ
jgi:sulfide dehydrogenase cytochrome subunit